MRTWSNVVHTVEAVVNQFYPLFSSVLVWVLGIIAVLVAVTVIVWLGVAIVLGTIEARSTKAEKASPEAEAPLSVFD